MKTCSKCGVKKSLDHFYKQPRNKDGLECQCKSCRRRPHKNDSGLTIGDEIRAKAKQRALSRYGEATLEAMTAIDSFDEDAYDTLRGFGL